MIVYGELYSGVYNIKGLPPEQQIYTAYLIEWLYNTLRTNIKVLVCEAFVNFWRVCIGASQQAAARP